jgi:uncharacterized membrane protein YgcG
MKRLLIGLLVLAIGASAHAATPARTGGVTDAANVLTAATEAELRSIIRTAEAQANVELVVLTVGDLDGQTIERYARRVFRDWNIGKSSRRGVLLLVAPRDRAVRIEVGSPLAPILPDHLAAQVVRDDLLPFLRDNQFDGAVRSGLLRLAGIAQRNQVVVVPRSPLAVGAMFIAFVGGITFAPLFLGTALESRRLAPGAVALASAAAAIYFAPARPASTLGWVGWGAALVWMGVLFSFGLQWRRLAAEVEADRVKKKAAADARWAAIKAGAVEPPQPAPEPEHWIFNRDTSLADGAPAPPRRRWDRDRHDRNHDRSDDNGGHSGGSSGGATGHW